MNTLHLGRFIVSVPRHHHERGHIERPDVWSLWREEPEKHFIIVKREQLSYENSTEISGMMSANQRRSRLSSLFTDST